MRFRLNCVFTCGISDTDAGHKYGVKDIHEMYVEVIVN